MEGKGKGQQGKNQAKPNQNKQQQNQGKKGGGKGQGKAPQGGGQPKPPQKQVPEAGVAEPTPPVQTQALSDAPVELSLPKPAESLQSGLLPEAEVISEKLPAANKNTQEKSKSSEVKTEGPPKSGPEPPPVPPRAAQAPRNDQALAPLAPGNNESDRAKSPVPSQDKGKNSKGSKGNNKQQGQMSSKPVDTPAVSLQVETKPQAPNDGENKAAKQKIENPVVSSESPKDPIKEAPASGKLPVQAPSFADKAKSPAPKGKSDQKDKGKEHAPSNQQKGGGPQEQTTKNDSPAQDIPAPTTQSPIALGLGSEVTGPEVSQPPLRQEQPDNVQTKQQQQQPQQKPQQPQQKAQQQKQQEQPQQKQQEPQKQTEDIQQKPQQPQQKQQQQPQQKQPEQSQQKLQQQKQPEQPQQKPQQQKQQEQPQQKPQQQKQPEQPQQKPQQQKQQEQVQQKPQQLQPQQKQQEQTQQKPQQQPQQKQPEQPVQKPQQQQPQQKQLEQSQQKPQQGQQKPEMPQQKPLNQKQSPPKTPSSSIASSAFPAKSASAKTPVDDFDDDLIMDADFEPLFDDLSAPPAHKPAGLVQKHSPMLDADFDPLFSQISDSTKTMVGVACPAAAKPSAPIPIPKDISKEQTQGSVSPSSPGSRSKKSKHNKGAVQQDSPKSEPVDIKNPVIATTVGLVATAVAVGSSMTGEKHVPQSPKKQQSGNSKQSPITESPQPQKSAPIDIKSAPSLDVSSLSGSPANTPKDKPLSESPSKQSTKKGKSMPIDIKPSAAAQASPIGSPLVSEAKDKPLSESPSKSKKGKSTPIDITSAAAISVPLGSPLATDASVTLSESPGKQGKKGKSPQDPGSPLPLPGSPKLSSSPIVDKKPKDAKPVDEKLNDSKKQDPNRKGNQNKEPVPTQPPKPESQKQPSKEHIPPKPSLDTSVAPEDPKPEPKKQQQNKAEKNPQKPEPKPSEVGVRTTKIDDIANMTSPTAVVDVTNRLNSLEKENVDLKKKVVDLTSLVSKLEIRVKDLEKGGKSNGAVSNAHAASQAVAKTTSIASQKSPAKADDDDGVDLFGSDSEEDEEATKIKEQRLAEYAAKKSKKPAIIAKSSIILDVKPWDDETDMKEMEKKVREISADGLLWGASKLVPLAYGIHKLQINCVVEDDKISIDWLQETIEEIQDYVQSVDVAAFNKI